MKLGMTYADLSIIGLLNIFGIFIFSGFCILAFLKYIFPKIINEYLGDKIHDVKYLSKSLALKEQGVFY